jgi:hypothetical protein
VRKAPGLFCRPRNGALHRRAAAPLLSKDWVENAGEDAAVARLAPQNAASVAGLLLTMEVMIAEAPQDEEHAHGGAPGGMGGMDI